MHILHVYKDYFPVLGGIENHVRLLARGQAAAGHHVTVLVTNPARHGFRTTLEDDGGVRVIRAGRLATVASTPLSMALPLHLLRQQPDLVHLHFPYPVGEVSQYLLRRGRRTVMTYHSDVVRQAAILRLYRPLLRRVLAAMDAFIISSPPMARSHYLAPYLDKLHLIPFGLPLPRFTPVPPPVELERVRRGYLGRLGAPPGSPLLLFVGRLRYYKGLDVLLRALPALDAGLPAVLAVVGSGPMAGPWQALAAELGVAGRVAWLGEVPDADLPLLYHLADLFVLPASHPSEAFGLVQVEAMAAGLPVVCTELGTGTSYVNQDGLTGRVVPPRDPQALAAAIAALLLDPAERSRLGAAARARAEAEFSLQTMIERTLHLYGELLASH